MGYEAFQYGPTPAEDFLVGLSLAKQVVILVSVSLMVAAMVFGGSLEAPPGLFKDLNDQIVGDAIILNGK